MTIRRRTSCLGICSSKIKEWFMTRWGLGTIITFRKM